MEAKKKDSTVCSLPKNSPIRQDALHYPLFMYKGKFAIVLVTL